MLCLAIEERCPQLWEVQQGLSTRQHWLTTVLQTLKTYKKKKYLICILILCLHEGFLIPPKPELILKMLFWKCIIDEVI